MIPAELPRVRRRGARGIGRVLYLDQGRGEEVRTDSSIEWTGRKLVEPHRVRRKAHPPVRFLRYRLSEQGFLMGTVHKSQLMSSNLRASAQVSGWQRSLRWQRPYGET